LGSSRLCCDVLLRRRIKFFSDGNHRPSSMSEKKGVAWRYRLQAVGRPRGAKEPDGIGVAYFPSRSRCPASDRPHLCVSRVLPRCAIPYRLAAQIECNRYATRHPKKVHVPQIEFPLAAGKIDVRRLTPMSRSKKVPGRNLGSGIKDSLAKTS
jgi:hypothetical protein